MDINIEESRIALSEIKTGLKCVIVKVNGHGGLRHRLIEMGFAQGVTVTVLKNAPLLDPIEYQVMQAHVSLRRSEADKIEVVPLSEDLHLDFKSHGTIVEENAMEFNKHISDEIKEKSHTVTVALVGNPNCGKTSFFNHATGLREKVGNYSGVTVDIKTGVAYHNGYTIRLVDLPGTYSMTDYTPEERYVRDFLTKSSYDLILNIVDASNLERNLFLTTQIIDMNYPMVMALNMYDELVNKGDTLAYDDLGKMLGIPIVPTTASKGGGIDEVLDTIIDVYENRRHLTKHIHVNFGNDIESAIVPIKKKIEANKDILNVYPARYLAITALEGMRATIDELSKLPNGDDIVREANSQHLALEKAYNEETTDLITNARHNFIRGALKETYLEGEKSNRWSAYKADDLLTSRWLGFPILLVFMWLMFEATFIVGEYPMRWIEAGMEWLGVAVKSLLPAGILNDLVVDGIIAGVGGVIVFLPNILILFFFISILEDTGYMARAAFIMDKLMHRIGLHGKSFIPFIIGFGCGVPAIMATRTLENRKDRIVTILVTPFMSCSARLPVYLLFVAAFFTKHQGIVLLSVYAIGVAMAVLTAFLLNKTVFKGLSEQFVMELPPYRIPTLRNILIHIWDKSVQYLKKMGTVILAASVIIWALEYFPTTSERQEAVAQKVRQVQSDSGLSSEQVAEQVAALERELNAIHSEESYIGRLGRFIEPVVYPCGFDWRMGVSLMTGIAAKEVTVSTMAVLFQAEENAEGASSLQGKLKAQVWGDGDRVGEALFTPAVAYAFMVFVLLSTPCFATLAAVRREAGLGWAFFTFFYNTFVAWLAATVIYLL